MASDIERLAKEFKGNAFKSVRATLMAQAEQVRALGGPEHLNGQVKEARGFEGRKFQLEIGGKSVKQLERELKKARINIGDYARDMLRSKAFSILPKPESIDLVKVTVAELGFNGVATTDQIYKKAQELGLELAPAEVGPRLRLQDQEQTLGDWYWIGMKQIADRTGDSRVFGIERHERGLWLRSFWAGPDYEWDPRHRFVFGLRR